MEQLEQRLDKILLELENLRKDLPKVGRCENALLPVQQNLVIFCDPSRPMYFLEVLLGFISEIYSVSVSVHTHSTVAVLPQNLNDFCSKFKKSASENNNTEITVAIVWKVLGVDAVLKIGQTSQIVGEVNIARYFNRLIEARRSDVLEYESGSLTYADEIDAALDKIHSALHKATGKQLASMQNKSKSRYLLGNKISVVDIVWDSVIKYNK